MTELSRTLGPVSVSDSLHLDPSETYIPHRTEQAAKNFRVLGPTKPFFSSTNASEFFHGRLDKSDGRDVTLKFSTTGFIDNEYEGLSILHMHGIKVPEPIALVDRDKHPKTGIIMARIFGDDFSDVSSRSHRFILGQEVRKANEISVSGFGLIPNGIAQFQSAEEHVRAEATVMMPHIQSDTEAVQLLSELWNKVRGDVSKQQPRFIHRDLKGRNAMVAQSGDVMLLDLEYWNGGDPLWDVGGYLFYVLRSGKPQSDFQDFLQGYTNGKELTRGQGLRILFYTLFSAGRFVELVARVDPKNIDYAANGLNKVSNFVRSKFN